MPLESVQRTLPVALGLPIGSEDMSERDILYKVLFDMKKDIVELKQVVARLMQSAAESGLEMPNQADIDHPTDWTRPEPPTRKVDGELIQGPAEIVARPMPRSVVFEDQPAVEDIEENFSLEEVERRMIDKALRKHSGKRKYAAQELGISERTLYRKIKEYGMEEG